MEIERKYLVHMEPENLKTNPVQQIAQGYISREPVIRVRSVTEEGQAQYVLTVKGPGLVEREEFELALSEGQYTALCRKVDGYIIEKRRYRIPLPGGLIAELDEFLGRLKGLWLAEVEFSTAAEMAEFTPPVWFGEDVSEDGRYQNSRLSQAESTP